MDSLYNQDQLCSKGTLTACLKKSLAFYDQLSVLWQRRGNSLKARAGINTVRYGMHGPEQNLSKWDKGWTMNPEIGIPGLVRPAEG